MNFEGVILSGAKNPDALFQPGQIEVSADIVPCVRVFAMPQEYVVYILGSLTGTLYIGITNDLDRRVTEHRNGVRAGFASKYGCTRLLYAANFPYVEDAIAREKQLKGWTRAKKLDLIRTINPEFRDLAQQLGWLQIGPARSIAEEEDKLQRRIKLPRDSSLRSE